MRSLQVQAPGRLTRATARLWVDRWRRLLPPPADAPVRAERLGRDLARHQLLQADIAATAGQMLTTLPGVAVIRPASFAAHSLPTGRFPTAEHLDAATGLAPAVWQSASLHRRGRISRQGLPEHRDALMGIAWGLSPTLAELPRARPRAARPRHATSSGPRRPRRHACRLWYALLTTQQPFDQARDRSARHSRGR